MAYHPLAGSPLLSLPSSLHPEQQVGWRNDSPQTDPDETSPSSAVVRLIDRSLDIGAFGARGIPSTYGGYETFLTVLLPELAARGHRVTAYCRQGELEHHDSYAGVRCVALPTIRTKQLSTLSHGWLAAGRSVAARHDVVLVVNVANTAACLAARALGQRIVLNTDGQEWKRSKWGPPARAVFRGSAHLTRWGATAVVTDSSAMRTIYAGEFGATSTVIPYFWPGIEPGPEAELARFGVERRRYFLVAARLVPENNVHTIARAYLASGHRLPLLVLGTANYASPVLRDLERLALEHPRLVLGGHVEDRRLFTTLLANATAYLHGHSVGGTNPSLLEAMGCGARIVALDTAFNREALGGAGDYFREPSELSALLRAVATEPAGAGEAKRQAVRDRARSRFSLTAVVDAYEQLLGVVASRSPWRRTTLPTRWADGDAESSLLHRLNGAD